MDTNTSFNYAPWIKGFKNLYKIFPDGTIVSFKRNPGGKVLKPRISGNGYLTVILTNKFEKQFQLYVHRLIAEHFLINLNKKKFTIVAHKDGNVLNNNVSNLFWTNTLGKLQNQHGNIKKKLTDKKMVNRKISENALKKIVLLIKKSPFGNLEKISDRYKISRVTLLRLRKTNQFKKLMNS